MCGGDCSIHYNFITFDFLVTTFLIWLVATNLFVVFDLDPELLDLDPDLLDFDLLDFDLFDLVCSWSNFGFF